MEKSESAPVPPPRVEPVVRRAVPNEPKPAAKPEGPNNNHDVDSQSLPEAKDLIKKMEEISKTMAPDWCVEYTFPDLEDLKKERASLSDSIRQTQAKIAALDSKIALLDGLKNALLAAEGEDLTSACSKVWRAWSRSNAVCTRAIRNMAAARTGGLDRSACSDARDKRSSGIKAV